MAVVVGFCGIVPPVLVSVIVDEVESAANLRVEAKWRAKRIHELHGWIKGASAGLLPKADVGCGPSSFAVLDATIPG